MAIDIETRPADMPVVFDVVRTATRATRQALTDGRQFWLAMATLLGAILVALGMLFGVFGDAVTSGAKTFIVVDNFGPGGLRGHGFGWLVMGSVLITSVCGARYAPTWAPRVTKAILWVIMADLLWTAFAMGLAGEAGGKTSWIATTLFAGLAFWPGLQVVLRPTTRRPRSSMRSAMINEGLSPAQADRVLARRSGLLDERSH